LNAIVSARISWRISSRRVVSVPASDVGLTCSASSRLYSATRSQSPADVQPDRPGGRFDLCHQAAVVAVSAGVEVIFTGMTYFATSFAAGSCGW
jgi:hypothetical protein